MVAEKEESKGEVMDLEFLDVYVILRTDRDREGMSLVSILNGVASC